jgi:hypothetical protein
MPGKILPYIESQPTAPFFAARMFPIFDEHTT